MTTSGRPPLEGPIRTVGVVLRHGGPEVAPTLTRLLSFFAERGVEVGFEEGTENCPDGARTLDLTRERVDLVVALGGDGTLLRAARTVLGMQIPVLGVNLGRLGFLTAFPADEMESGLVEVVEGRAVLDDRFTLRTMIEDGSGAGDDLFFALNDVVVHTSGAARVSQLMIEIGSSEGWEEAGSFSADGVILATPTGSTAYSMSAGGPIIVPEVEAIVVTPICPHSLAVRPLVVPAHRRIRVKVLDESSDHQLTVDGQVVRALSRQESVVVGREPAPVPLVRLAGQTFLGTLRRKLNWAARPPERT